MPGLRRITTVLLSVVGLLATTGCLATDALTPRPDGGGEVTTALPGTEPDPGTASDKPAVPATGSYFGMWINPVGDQTKAAVQAKWAEREAAMGRTADIAHSFYPFSTSFPSWRETWHLQHGRTPMISWNGTYSSDVNRGDHDDLIRTRAQGVKALGAPVFLRYFWEPEGSKKVAMAESPAAYIEQFRRVHRIFAQEGVTNAAWVWCPTSWGFKAGTAQPYYPGDDVVDWICADGYNFGPTKPSNTWSEWTTIYDAFYAFGQAHGKPLMAGEYGSVERYPGEKAAWFRSARNQIKAMPGIKAVVYFDCLRYEDSVWHDWRPDTSPDSWTAFTELAQDPYFNP